MANNVVTLRQLKTIRAADLMQMEFPEPKWAVPGILPEGLNILGGKPKKGKSMFAMNICLSITCGTPALGSIDVEQGTVIYLALEDIPRRLHERIKIMLQGEKPPEGLILGVNSERMDRGGLSQLKDEMRQHVDLRLVVIDTFAMFKPAESKNFRSPYDVDYDQISQIKAVADEFGVSLLLIHHLTKGGNDDDVMESFAGTHGLTGAADGLLALTRSSESSQLGTLNVTGRDLQAEEYSLRFDNDTLRWTLHGDVRDLQSTPMQQLLYDAIRESSCPLSPKELAEKLDFREQYVKNTLPKLLNAGRIRKADRGKYEYNPPINN